MPIRRQWRLLTPISSWLQTAGSFHKLDSELPPHLISAGGAERERET